MANKTMIAAGFLAAAAGVVGGVKFAHYVGERWEKYEAANCTADMPGCTPNSKVTGNVPVLIPANDKQALERIIKMDAGPGLKR